MNKQKICVFEGCDMTGKTQIAQSVAAKLGISYYKASNEHDAFVNKQDYFINSLRFSDTRLVDFIRQTQTSVVFDRCWPSEAVYAQFFNRATDFDVIAKVDNAYAEMGAKIIICTRSSFEGIYDDLRPDWIGPQQLLQLNNLYLAYMKSTKCKYMLLNVDDENLERETNEVISFLTNT